MSMRHELTIPNRLKEMSRHSLMSIAAASRHALAERGKLGGAGPAIVSHGVSMGVRHAMTSLLGPPATMQMWQQVVCGVLAAGAAGFRFGMANVKLTPAMVAAAAASEGLCAALTERLLESFAKLNPA